MYTHRIRTKQYNAYIPTEYEQMNEQSNVMHTYWIRTKQYCNVPTHWIQTKEYCSVPTHWIRTKEYTAYIPTEYEQNNTMPTLLKQCLPTEYKQSNTMRADWIRTYNAYPLNAIKWLQCLYTHWIRTKLLIQCLPTEYELNNKNKKKWYLATEYEQSNTMPNDYNWIRTKQYNDIPTEYINIHCLYTDWIKRSNAMLLATEYRQNNTMLTHWIRTKQYEQEKMIPTHWIRTKQYDA